LSNGWCAAARACSDAGYRGPSDANGECRDEQHDEDAAEVAKQAGKPEHQLDHHRRQQEADTPSGAISSPSVTLTRVREVARRYLHR
jgi:hypothetical protein